MRKGVVSGSVDFELQQLKKCKKKVKNKTMEKEFFTRTVRKAKKYVYRSNAECYISNIAIRNAALRDVW